MFRAIDLKIGLEIDYVSFVIATNNGENMENISIWENNGQKYEYNGFIYVPRSSTNGKPFKPLEVDKELVEISNIGFAARKKPVKLADNYADDVNSSGSLEFIIEPHLKLANAAIGPIIGVFIATREYVDGLAYTCADIVSIHQDFWGKGVMKGGINVLAELIKHKNETPYLVLRTSDEDANEAYLKVFQQPFFGSFVQFNNLNHVTSGDYYCHGKLCGNIRPQLSRYQEAFEMIFKHLQGKEEKLVPV